MVEDVHFGTTINGKDIIVMSKDVIGDRMKSQYENRTRMYLPRRTYTIIRIDGKAFHTFTKGLDKPFDKDLMEAMAETTKFLCKEIQGCKFGYTQSDEISLVMTDFDGLQTNAWFDGNIQKIVSIASSLATAKFNQIRVKQLLDARIDDIKKRKGPKRELPLAMFDARVFTIADYEEVLNYFIWRQMDATRNSIQMAARAHFSHKECNNKNTSDLQDLLMTKDINWNDYTSQEKRGTFVGRVEKPFLPATENTYAVNRIEWDVIDCPIFTQEREFLYNKLPKLNG